MTRLQLHRRFPGICHIYRRLDETRLERDGLSAELGRVAAELDETRRGRDGLSAELGRVAAELDETRRGRDGLSAELGRVAAELDETRRGRAEIDDLRIDAGKMRTESDSKGKLVDPSDYRTVIGRTLSGDVLEIGAGHIPFPVAEGAGIRYADRSVEGGRDANWPELIGSPRGPRADFDLNINVDGLAPIPDRSLDVVIASHVIEHLTNPIAALREFERVLRYYGRLVLMAPDRNFTFDAPRQPTPLSVLLDKYHRGVHDITNAEIREFCYAIYYQPPIHPPLVREWYNPHKLSPDINELHRRRSIHVHCWSPEEFASFIVGTMCRALVSYGFSSLYLPGDYEFGIVLERRDATGTAAAATFASAWATAALDGPNCDPKRIARFAAALHRDLGESDLEAVMGALDGAATRSALSPS